jgi:hypothetical protein
MTGADEVRWSRRVKPATIRRLYTLDAKGIVDEDLINEEGYAMYARCLSIRAVTRAHGGKATCPRCRSELMRHDLDWTTWKKDEAMVCPCGWETTSGAYHKTYQGKQLHGGGAYPIFRGFIDRWPASRTPRDKMLAIDASIHECHGQFKGAMGRPAACNLIEGTMRELVDFLNELAYGDLSTPGVGEVRERWNAGVQGAAWMRHRRGVEEAKAQTEE